MNGVNPSTSTPTVGFISQNPTWARDINVGWIRRAVYAVTNLKHSRETSGSDVVRERPEGGLRDKGR